MELRTYASIVAIAAITHCAFATDRYFRDSFAVSPSGKFRIDAKSPDNRLNLPFADNFTYTLTDTATGKVVWSRAQPRTRSKGSWSSYATERSPMRVFVDDEGCVTAWLASETLLILDPKDGHKRGEPPILRAFPANEVAAYVSDTTAGPMWAQQADWYFVNMSGSPARTYFVVRPYWNHRLVIDTATARYIGLRGYHAVTSAAECDNAGADLAPLLKECLAIETARSMKGLEILRKGLNDADDWESWQQVSTHLHTVMLLRLEQAEPVLRTFELAIEPRRSGSIRRALRAIGATPRAIPGGVSPQARVAAAGRIEAGMKRTKVTDLLGDEDCDLRGISSLDFDIDADAPFTLRVSLQHNDVVTSVQRITPFAFLHDPDRMRHE